MALFQPTNVTPSDINGTGTVDITKDLSFSWQVNGSSPMTAYQIRIFQNDTESTLKYDTGKVVLTSPFYGNDRNGDPQFFGAVIAHSPLEQAGITNGYANGYKFLVKQWWGENDAIEQTSANAFITRKTPDIEIDDMPEVVDNKRYVFTATYTQEQGDTVDWVQWEIADGMNTEKLLLDSGKINTNLLETEYDGFLTGQSYMIRCTIQTENGVQESTGWKTFRAEYPLSSVQGVCRVCGQCEHDAVKVTFPDNFAVIGEGHGEWVITEDKKLVLNGAGDWVVWNTSNGEGLVLTAPYSVSWRGTVYNTENETTVLRLKDREENEITVTVKKNGLTVKKGDTVIGTVNETVYNGDRLTVRIEEESLYMRRETEHDGMLTPSAALYPGTSLYPSAGSHAEYEYTEEMEGGWQENITEVLTKGGTEGEYIWIVKGDFTQEQKEETEGEDKPERDGDTQFLADYENGLNAGAVDVTDIIKWFDVYRKESGETVIRHIARIASTDSSFFDFSACSQRTYSYVVYGIQDNGEITTPFESDPVTPLFWNWTVLCCTEDESGRMRVRNEYRFALEVESGSINNNNAPTLQKNFTMYPTRQPVSTNYRSGTLSAYVGKAKDGRLIDSISMIDELYALSVSKDTKYLKNRKGNIYMMETNGAVAMTTEDKYAAQPCKASIPWVETGRVDRYPVALESDPVMQN